MAALAAMVLMPLIEREGTYFSFCNAVYLQIPVAQRVLIDGFVHLESAMEVL